MGTDGEVVIPIRLTIDTSMVEKEASDSLEKLKPELERLNREISEVRDNAKRIEFTNAIKGASELANTMANLISESNAHRNEVSRLKQEYDNARRALGKTVEATDENIEEVELLHQTWLAAKRGTSAYEEQMKDLNEPIDEHIAKLRELSREIAIVRANEKATARGTSRWNKSEAIDSSTESLTIFEKVLERVKQKSEEYGVEREKVAKFEQTYNETKIQSLPKVLELEKQIDEEISKITQEESNQVDLENSKNEAIARQRAEIQTAIRAEQETAKQAKLTTSQYYYRLRSMKMVNRYLQILNKAMDNFGKKSLTVSANIVKNYLKIATGFGLLRKSISLLLTGLGKIGGRLGLVSKAFAKTNKEIKRTTASHKDFGKSIGSNLKLFLKYALGIRSLFVLFNRLRSAMMDGLTALATQFEEVNDDMSSLKSSLTMMKNALGAMVQPIVSALVPAFETLSDAISNVSVKVASFFAAFTGQQYVYKAKRTQEQFVEAVEDSKKAMEDSADASEEAKGQLQSYDKLLNVTTKDEKDKSEDKGGLVDAFDTVPVDKKVADLVDKIKKLLSDFFKPLKNAWDKEGKFVMESWKYALGEVWKLIKDIGRDFMRVWQEQRTQEIFENLLHVLGDIGLIVGHLARNFREAWNENENGYRILASIRDIIWIISKGLREAADYTVEWADALSFKPLLGAIADVLEKQIVPAIQKVVDLLVYLYKTVLLELLRYLIEELLPIVVKIFGYIIEAIGNIAENIQKALEKGQLGEKIVKRIEDTITIVAEGILDCAKYTAEWSKNLNFEPFFSELLSLLDKIGKATQKIVDLMEYLYKKILLKIVQDFIEKGMPQLERIAGFVVDTIGNIADNLRKALEENDRGTRLLEHTEALVGKVADVIEDCAEKTAKWSENLDFGNLLDAIDGFLVKIQPAVSFVAETLGKLWTNVLLPLWEYLIEQGLPKLLETLGQISEEVNWDELKAKVDAFLEAFEKFLEKAWDTLVIILSDIGTAIKDFANSETFGKFVDILIDWMTNADPEDMAKGIERLAQTFAALKAGLTFLTYAGALKEFVMTLKNWHNNKVMTETIAQTSANIAKLNQSLDGLPSKLSQTSTEAGAASTSVGALGSSAGSSAVATAAASAVIVAAIAVVAGAFVTLWTTDEDFRNRMQEDWNNIVNVTKKSCDDIVQALNTLGFNFTSIKDVWIGFCETIAPMFSNALRKVSIMIEGFGTLLTGMINMIGGVVNTIRGLLDKNLSQVEAGVLQFAKGMGQMKEANSSVTKLMISDVQTMSEVFDNTMNGMSNNAETTSTNLTNSASNIGQSVDGVSASYENLGGVVTTQSQTIDTALANTQTGIDNFNTSFGTLDTTVSNTATSISTNTPMINESIDNAMTLSSNSVATGRTNIEGELDILSSDFSNTPSHMYNGFASGWNNTFGINGATLIMSLISPSFYAVLKAVNTILGIGSPSKEFEDIAMYSVEGFKLGFENNWPSITAFFDEVLPEMLENIRDMWDDFVDAGEDLIDGLLEGLQNAWDDVVDWIFDVCDDLVDDIKSFFGIHSPSRVMMGIGEYISEGLAMGIENKANDAVDATKDIATDIVQEASRIAEETSDDVELNFTLTESLNNLEKMVEQANILRDVFNSINVIASNVNTESLKIPDIATGKVLPTRVNIMTAQNNNDDALNTDAMYNVINDAVYSAIKSAYNNGFLSDSGEIIMQADGREIARAVKREADIYRRSTGRSMFNV